MMRCGKRARGGNSGREGEKKDNFLSNLRLNAELSRHNYTSHAGGEKKEGKKEEGKGGKKVQLLLIYSIPIFI